MIGLAIHRHPELVSGSIFPLAKSKRFKAQARGKIMPIGIAAFDQIDLPLPMPMLELLFSLNRRNHVAKQFESNEQMNSVARRETPECTLAVLPKARDEVACDADIEGAKPLTGKDIDARVAFKLHESENAEKWTLKQVQGDEGGFLTRHFARLTYFSTSIYPPTRSLAA